MSLLDELAATLGVPTDGLRTLQLSIERDGEARLEAGFEALVAGETLRTLGYRLVEHAAVVPRMVQCPWGTVDAENGVAYWPDGRHVVLSPKERGLLGALARKPDCVVTKRELLIAAWGAEYADQGHYVRIVMSSLRRKIGDSQPWHLIEGITGGYVLRTA